MRHILFIAHNTVGSGLSGGERIFIEFMKDWRKYAKITAMGSQEVKDMASQRGAGDVSIIVSDRRNDSPNRNSIAGLFLHHARRLICGFRSMRANRAIVDSADVIYSVSDHYPDLIPALFVKLRRRQVFWIAGYYLFVPHPFSSESPYKGRHRLRGFLYWLMQVPSHFFVKYLADCVFVTSFPDVEKFITPDRAVQKVVVVRGGVDISASEKYLNSGNVIPVTDRKYDVCFIGRLHYQKGALELIDIWKFVLKQRPAARLVMIGDGPLENELKDRIARAGLAGSIDMVGFLDGEAKYDIFKQSKMIVHPAIYDSGGMAAAEGMAWRLPAISFDLEALKTYYPKGMLKTRKGELSGFADNIVRLLSDTVLYETTADDAYQLIVEEWDWSKRARQIYEETFKSNESVNRLQNSNCGNLEA